MGPQYCLGPCSTRRVGEREGAPEPHPGRVPGLHNDREEGPPHEPDQEVQGEGLQRRFDKTIRYASRKAYAEIRPRIKGRFVKACDLEEYHRRVAAGEDPQSITFDKK